MAGAVSARGGGVEDLRLQDGEQELSEVASTETAALLTEAVSPPRSRGWLDG